MNGLGIMKDNVDPTVLKTKYKMPDEGYNAIIALIQTAIFESNAHLKGEIDRKILVSLSNHEVHCPYCSKGSESKPTYKDYNCKCQACSKHFVLPNDQYLAASTREKSYCPDCNHKYEEELENIKIFDLLVSSLGKYKILTMDVASDLLKTPRDEIEKVLKTEQGKQKFDRMRVSDIETIKLKNAPSSGFPAPVPSLASRPWIESNSRKGSNAIHKKRMIDAITKNGPMLLKDLAKLIDRSTTVTGSLIRRNPSIFTIDYVPLNIGVGGRRAMIGLNRTERSNAKKI